MQPHEDRETRLTARTARILARAIGSDVDYVIADKLIATARAQAEEELEAEDAASAVTIDLEHDAEAEKQIRLAVYRECKDICLANDDDASASDIGQIIQALEHPESTRG